MSSLRGSAVRGGPLVATCGWTGTTPSRWRGTSHRRTPSMPPRASSSGSSTSSTTPPPASCRGPGGRGGVQGGGRGIAAAPRAIGLPTHRPEAGHHRRSNPTPPMQCGPLAFVVQCPPAGGWRRLLPHPAPRAPPSLALSSVLCPLSTGLVRHLRFLFRSAPPPRPPAVPGVHPEGHRSAVPVLRGPDHQEVLPRRRLWRPGPQPGMPPPLPGRSRSAGRSSPRPRWGNIKLLAWN